MPNQASPTYCALAFNGYNQQTKNVCCMIDTANRYDDFEELMNSPEIKNIQQAMDNGDKPKLCRRCWDDEDQGLKSHRQKQSAKQLEFGVDQDKLVYLTLFTGNICNFACRTCNSIATFQLAKEEKWIDPNNKTYGKTYADYEKILEQDLANVKYVGVLGGEPFLDEDHFKVIDKIVESGGSDKCHIHYSTNGSINIRKFYNKNLSTFDKVSISFSIDAVGAAFEYIRTNGKWPQVDKNIRDAVKLRDEVDNLEIHFHSTISPLNIFELDDLDEYATELGLHVIPQIVDYPEHYSFNVFADDIKEELMDRYFGQFDEVVKRGLETSSFNYQMYEKFVFHILKTNEFRGLDIEYSPELQAWINSDQ